MGAAYKLPVYDCQSCGACCISDFDLQEYVAVEEGEMLSPAFAHLITKDLVGTRSLKTKYDSRGNCVCIALHGSVGTQVECGVYESRPSICREFKPGSRACVRARRDAGLDVGWKRS